MDTTDTLDTLDTLGTEWRQVDINEGTGVEGKAEADGVVVTNIGKIPFPCSSSSRQRKETASLRSYDSADDVIEPPPGFRGDGDFSTPLKGQKAKQQLFERLDNTPRRPATPRALFVDVRLKRCPSLMRTNDVYGLYSPTKGILEVKKCERNKIVGKEVEDFLLSEALAALDKLGGGQYKDENADMSLQAVCGSPATRPIVDVSAILFDGPDILQMEERTINIFDEERNRNGILNKIGDEVANVEVLKSGKVIMNVELEDLVATDASRTRCGTFVSNGVWIGMITKVERYAQLKIMKNKRKIKIMLNEEDGQETLWTFLNPHLNNMQQRGDTYSDSEIPMYKGQIIKINKKLAESRYSIFSRLKKRCFSGLQNALRRSGTSDSDDHEIEDLLDALVQKVKVKSVEVSWIDKMSAVGDAPQEMYTHESVDDLLILAPDATSVCEINSTRIYRVGEDTMIDKDQWVREIAARYINSEASIDEVDKSKMESVETRRSLFEALTQNFRKLMGRLRKDKKKVVPGEEVAVKVLLKFRTAEVIWEDGKREILEMPKLLQMMASKHDVSDIGSAPQETEETPELEPSASKDSKVPLPTQGMGRGLDQLDDDSIHLEDDDFNSSAIMEDSDFLASFLSDDAPANNPFKEGDFVAPARDFACLKSRYGIVRRIYKSADNDVGPLAKVDWFEVNEKYETTRLETNEVPVCDLISMDQMSAIDASFRVIWKSKQSYSSEIVYRRVGITTFNKKAPTFIAGYVTEVTGEGKLIIKASHKGDEHTWELWPCEVASLKKSCYQDEMGDWKLVELV